MTDYTELNRQLVALLSQCAESDEDALTELYHLTSANLMAVQVRILGMNGMAERALHDTYIRVWMKSSSYSEALGQPLPWLTSIARNHALNLRRARLLDKMDDDDMDETAELVAEFADTAFLDQNPDTTTFKTAFDGLDAHTRDAIVRSYIDGWSLQELSYAYNEPVASIQESMHAGMLSLRGRS